MKKKIVFVIMIIFIPVAIIGSKLYVENQKMKVARNLFLEWFNDVETEEIAEWQIFDMRNGWLPDEVIRMDIGEENKKEFCQIIKDVSVEQVKLGEGCDTREFVDLRIFTTNEQEWVLRYADNVIYMHGVPDELNELYGWWPWEIRNEKLNEFLSGLLEQ